ncbi:hypothetical protein [uncultured Ruegeria sp.]|uniref:hypothetical protein n=1 Tax=uncultured Ruegeria sp. TaxID=259304 RepID=UPI002627A584|nr:hypothetical protein [uncultured Ruegeria sp.]
MTVTVWIYGIATLMVIVGIVLAIRSSFARNKPKSAQGVKPGQGDTVVTGGETAGRGHTTPIRISKNPQDYAKAMAPKK